MSDQINLFNSKGSTRKYKQRTVYPTTVVTPAPIRARLKQEDFTGPNVRIVSAATRPRARARRNASLGQHGVFQTDELNLG